jgi:hypothetical protein
MREGDRQARRLGNLNEANAVIPLIWPGVRFVNAVLSACSRYLLTNATSPRSLRRHRTCAERVRARCPERASSRGAGHHPLIRLLLGKSLAEEENADSLLTQVAREFVAQTGASARRRNLSRFAKTNTKKTKRRTKRSSEREARSRLGKPKEVTG